MKLHCTFIKCIAQGWLLTATAFDVTISFAQLPRQQHDRVYPRKNYLYGQLEWLLEAYWLDLSGRCIQTEATGQHSFRSNTLRKQLMQVMLRKAIEPAGLSWAARPVASALLRY